jgi:hypothetical protein
VELGVLSVSLCVTDNYTEVYEGGTKRKGMRRGFIVQVFQVVCILKQLYYYEAGYMLFFA